MHPEPDFDIKQIPNVLKAPSRFIPLSLAPEPINITT